MQGSNSGSDSSGCGAKETGERWLGLGVGAGGTAAMWVGLGWIGVDWGEVEWGGGKGAVRGGAGEQGGSAAGRRGTCEGNRLLPKPVVVMVAALRA